MVKIIDRINRALFGTPVQSEPKYISPDALKRARSDMMKGDSFANIMFNTGLTEAELDDVMDHSQREKVIWMYQRGVDGHEIVRRTTLDPQEAWRIFSDWQANRKEGRPL